MNLFVTAKNLPLLWAKVGRGCPEAAVLYCSADVVRFLLTHLNTLTGDKKVEVRYREGI